MRVRFATIALVAMVGVGSGAPIAAQEGCTPARSSCTQMYQTCAQRCQTQNNPARCTGACEGPLSQCKSTGIWKSPVAPTCWKTNNRA